MKRGLLSQPQRIGERIASRNLLNINHPLAESSPVARIPISMIPGVGGIASGYMQEDLATLQQPEETFFNIPSSVYGIRDPRYFPLPGGANITNHDLARFGLATDAMDWIPGAAAVGSMATGAGLLGRWLKGNETPDSDAVSLWDAISPAMVDPRTGLLSMTGENNLANKINKTSSIEDRLRSKYPEVELSLSETDTGITLNQIVIPEHLRGEGSGSKIVREITKYADDKNVPVALTPDTVYGGKSKKALVNFYKKLGFVPNKGKNKDFRFRESYIREPVEPSKKSVKELKDDLPMDEASRMRRAQDMGFDTDVYHGTTHDIEAFDTAKANPESDWGAATYTTTSLDDVNPNYAGEGPDLTNRITQRQEQIANENDWPLEDTRALELARGELVGSKGAIYPLKVNTEKYAVIGDNSTEIEMPDYRGEAMQEINRADFDSLDEYEEALQEYIFDLENSDMDHPLLTIKDTLMRTAGDEYFGDEDAVLQAVEEIQQELYEGLTATRLDEIIRNNISGWEGENGEFFSAGAASAEVLKALGFEGVIDKTVDTKFGSSRKLGKSMEGVDPDTIHIITFPGFEKNIRSKSAKFDPKKINDSDLLSGRGLLNFGRAV